MTLSDMAAQFPSWIPASGNRRAKNDHFFGPELARAMFDAYRANGDLSTTESAGCVRGRYGGLKAALESSSGRRQGSPDGRCAPSWWHPEHAQSCANHSARCRLRASLVLPVTVGELPQLTAGGKKNFGFGSAPR
jgi:hypothetical protein